MQRVHLNCHVMLVQVVKADEEVLRFVVGDGDVPVWNAELAVELIGDVLRLVRMHALS
jgi:hypothetical protein